LRINPLQEGGDDGKTLNKGLTTRKMAIRSKRSEPLLLQEYDLEFLLYMFEGAIAYKYLE